MSAHGDRIGPENIRVRDGKTRRDAGTQAGVGGTLDVNVARDVGVDAGGKLKLKAGQLLEVRSSTKVDHIAPTID